MPHKWLLKKNITCLAIVAEGQAAWFTIKANATQPSNWCICF
jgi:hypothetical protein